VPKFNASRETSPKDYSNRRSYLRQLKIGLGDDLNSSLDTHKEDRQLSVRSRESNKLKPVEVSDDSSMDGELTLRYL
jgi:hypothetical protein